MALEAAKARPSRKEKREQAEAKELEQAELDAKVQRADELYAPGGVGHSAAAARWGGAVAGKLTADDSIAEYEEEKKVLTPLAPVKTTFSGL